jgi:hypothetical protein
VKVSNLGKFGENFQLVLFWPKILMSCLTTKVSIYWLNAIRLILIYNQNFIFQSGTTTTLPICLKTFVYSVKVLWMFYEPASGCALARVLHAGQGDQGPMLWFLKYFRRKNQWKKWRFWLKTKLNYAKFWSYHWFLRKTPIFCRKLAKIAEKHWPQISLKKNSPEMKPNQCYVEIYTYL